MNPIDGICTCAAYARVAGWNVFDLVNSYTGAAGGSFFPFGSTDRFSMDICLESLGMESIGDLFWKSIP